MAADDQTATRRADDALRRATYYLDRDLAPSGKVRAFTRAREIVAELGDTELDRRVRTGTLTDLDGIGPSTGSVITDAVRGTPSAYLERLEADTRIEVGDGAPVRAALRGDLHSHTRWSDGAEEVAVMARTASDLGHEYLAVTDHSARLTVAHGLDEERLARQLDEIAMLNEELAPFRILTGMEVDILEDGRLDLSSEMLTRLDVVVASVHSKLSMDAREMTRRMVMAVADPNVDVLGHCTGRKITGRGRPPSHFDAEVVFAACARFDTAVEINCRPERRDPPGELLDLALEWGCHVSIDTDAHAPGQLEWQPWGCDLAVEHGIDPARIVNTWTADELLAWAAAHPTA
ncbi:MAG: PHP domain-containing protein [Microthrixaceae bacterium]